MDFFSTYPYMLMSLTLLGIFVLCYLAGGNQRRPMILSALLSAPYGFLSFSFVPEYWDPVRVVEFSAGFEDLIFSFANGGIIWFFVTLPFRNRLIFDIHPRRIIRRYTACTVAGMLVGLVPHLIGWKPMTICLFNILIIGIALLWLQRDLWRFVFIGALAFGIFYTVICFTMFSLHPEFLNQWNHDALSGFSLLGVPVEEIAWSIGFGAVWPLMIAFTFETRVTAAERPHEQYGAAGCVRDVDYV